MALLASYQNNDPRMMPAWPGYTLGQGERQIGPDWSVGGRFWFPDETSRDRLQGYIEMEQLMCVDSHHQLYTQIAGGDAPAENDWIPVDFPGMLARLMRHYALGPEFGVSAKNDATDPQIQRIFEEGAVVERMRQCAEAYPVFGDSVLRIDIEQAEDEDGEMVPQAVPKFIHPGNYHPTFDQLDATRVESVTLAYVFVLDEQQRRDPKMPFVVLKETHVPGYVSYSAVEWDGSREGEPLSAEALFPGVQDAPTGVDEIPVIHIAYNAKGGCPWGRSEFARIMRLFLALENRITQEDEILERHARPKLIVGPGVLNPEGRANLADFDVIEIDPSILEKAVKPEYLTWDPKIDAVKHQLTTLMDFFFMTTETSPASFGMERSGSQVESARALRFKAHRTINKIEDLRDGLAHALKRLFRIAQKMENVARAEDGIAQYERSPIDIHFPDPIIEDHTQDAQDYAALWNAGLCSRERAVADLFNLTPEEAQAEVDAIIEDQKTAPVLPERAQDNPEVGASAEKLAADGGAPVPGARPPQQADAPSPAE